MQVARNQLRKEVEEALSRAPICLLLGPRQSGKTWMARTFSPSPDNYFDLESFVDQRRLENDPQGELARLYGLVVIDEVQRMPELFPLLRYLADRPERRARFLLLGSASPQLQEHASESLAGRVAYVDMAGFNVSEVNSEELETLMVQGGFPPAFSLPANDSFKWRLDYLRSLVDQDLRDLASIRIPAAALRNLLLFLAQSNGQVWNHSEAARMLSVDYKTIQRYMELLEGAFIIRLLRPFHVNLKKRLRKSPKVYFRDVGLVHALLSIRSYRELVAHPLYGASWEGFAIEQLVRILGLREEECFSYAVHSGDEMDLVVERAGAVYGFEFKASASPSITKSMLKVINDLSLEKVYVVFPGERGYRLSDKVEAVSIREIEDLRCRWETSS